MIINLFTRFYGLASISLILNYDETEAFSVSVTCFDGNLTRDELALAKVAETVLPHQRQLLHK